MDSMLSRALRDFMSGPLNQLLVNLGGQDGEQWERQLNRFLRKESCWDNGEVVQKYTPGFKRDSFQFISKIVVPANTNKFVAKKNFVVNTDDEASVAIGHINHNFLKSFLGGDGKIEEPISEQLLSCHKLCKESVCGLIINEFGGEGEIEATLYEMFFDKETGAWWSWRSS